MGLVSITHGIAENSLLYSNSYKMKMSIIMGVFHMSFGMLLQCYNHIHFGKSIYIYLEVLPQILYFWSIFGYLIFMILFKWLTPYPDPSKAPGLLNTLIYMFLSPGTVVMELYPGQAVVQALLLVVAFLAIPWMLLAKPYYEKYEHEKIIDAGYSRPIVPLEIESGHGAIDIPPASPAVLLSDSGAHTDDGVGNEHANGDHGEGFDFSDAMIHQMIHTIEFTLSGISNTASYLRLWALSLAHAQLSDVLWNMIFQSTLTMANPIAIVIGFYFWFTLTVAILIGMEGLSAFLHALRLHWVEFQNKFYGGTGYPFKPFSFKDCFIKKEE